MADPSQGAGAPPALPPNFYDAVPLANKESTILGVSIPLLIFCWLAIVARLWVRYFITKTPGWDDLFIVLALLTISTGAVGFCISTKYGMGHHIYLIPPGDISSFLICHYLDAATYNTSTALIKISLLFQYLRVFDRGSWDYRASQVLLIIIAAWGCVFAFLAWFPCLPDPSSLWHRTGKGCYASGSSNFTIVVRWIEAHAGSNLILDLAVLSLAFRLLFTKDAPTTKRGMAVLLSMGLVSCSFAIWRLAQIVTSRAGISDDLSWNLPGPTLLSFCEIYIACLLASVPFFWPILSKHIGKIFVSYEFNVSTESRYHDVDDQVELSTPDSWQPPSKTEGKDYVKSLGSRSNSRSGATPPPNEKQNATQYTNEYIPAHVDPFEHEFRTESAVEAAGSPRFQNTI